MNVFDTHNTVGIIGCGFVGNAILNACKAGGNDSVVIDVDPAKATGTYSDLSMCSGVFVCVPSPSLPDGRCDTSVLESVLSNLKEYTGVIISKVTAPPEVYLRLNREYKNLVYSPEFLTAQNAVLDFKRSDFAIIGGSVSAYVREAERVTRALQPTVSRVAHCRIDEAAYVKYAINSFLATKVTFMNELYNLVTTASPTADFTGIAQMMSLDNRIGKSHMQVPGPDGKFGFGGMCFPKDTQALLKISEDANIEFSVLEAVVKKNTFLMLQDK